MIVVGHHPRTCSGSSRGLPNKLGNLTSRQSSERGHLGRMRAGTPAMERGHLGRMRAGMPAMERGHLGRMRAGTPAMERGHLGRMRAGTPAMEHGPLGRMRAGTPALPGMLHYPAERTVNWTFSCSRCILSITCWFEATVQILQPPHGLRGR